MIRKSISNRKATVKKFKFLDHTADMGLIVYGKNLKKLFENAGEAFFHLITDLKKVRTKQARKIEVRSECLDRLMVDWLNELLYLHEVESLLFKKFVVEEVGQEGIKAKAWGEPYQDGVHVIKTGVKAATHHQIQVKKENNHWRAQVILDL